MSIPKRELESTLILNHTPVTSVSSQIYDYKISSGVLKQQKGYSRPDKSLKCHSGLDNEDMVSSDPHLHIHSADTPTSEKDFDLPITIRKGTGECT